MQLRMTILILWGFPEKSNFRGELPKKGGGLGQFADLRGDLAKKEVVFLRGCLYPQCTLWSMCVFKASFIEQSIVSQLLKNNKKLSVAICVCCIMSCSKISIFQDDVFQPFADCIKNFLFVNHGGDLR